MILPTLISVLIPKPQNLFVFPNREPKLCHFGVIYENLNCLISVTSSGHSPSHLWQYLNLMLKIPEPQNMSVLSFNLCYIISVLHFLFQCSYQNLKCLISLLSFNSHRIKPSVLNCQFGLQFVNLMPKNPEPILFQCTILP